MSLLTNNKVIQFLKESFEEVRYNVTWTKTSELYSSTTLVLIASLVFAVVVGSVDFAFKQALELFYNYVIK